MNGNAAKFTAFPFLLSFFASRWLTLFALSALFASIVELLRSLSRLLKESPAACWRVSLSDLRIAHNYHPLVSSKLLTSQNSQVLTTVSTTRFFKGNYLIDAS